MHQAAVGQLPHPRYAFVDGIKIFQVLSLEVFTAVPPVVEPHEEVAEVVLGAFADRQAIAREAAGLVDQGRGGWPVGIVEHGVGQRRHDPLVRLSVAHEGFLLYQFQSELTPRILAGLCCGSGPAAAGGLQVDTTGSATTQHRACVSVPLPRLRLARHDQAG